VVEEGIRVTEEQPYRLFFMLTHIFMYVSIHNPPTASI
jgi:hypothetical protein